MRSRTITIALVTLVVTACSGTSSTLVGYVPPSQKHVGNIEVAEWTENGPESFRFHADAGDVLVVYFGYTSCPDMCPTTMVNVRNAKNRIGDDLARRVDLAMVTVDPERDLGGKLKAYLGSFADRTHALVPETAEQLETAKNAFQVTSTVTKDDDGKVNVSHSGSAYVVNAAGDVVVEWPFGIDAKAMANDLRLLLSGGA
ncbi:MAG: hypothetical protein RLZZ526_1091 [Actinomycetota bacterium]